MELYEDFKDNTSNIRKDKDKLTDLDINAMAKVAR